MSITLKWVYPGFLMGLVLLIGLLQLGSDSPSPAIVLVPVIALALVGLFASTLWSLVDEVTDCGDTLVFRKGDTKQVVALTDIMNISADSMMVPRRLTVLTRKPGPLATSLSFGAPEVFPFIESALQSELVRRVDQARQEKSTN